MNRYLQKADKTSTLLRSEDLWSLHLAEVGTTRQRTMYAIDCDIVDDDDDAASKRIAESTLVFSDEDYEKFAKFFTEDEKATVTTTRPKDLNSLVVVDTKLRK